MYVAYRGHCGLAHVKTFTLLNGEVDTLLFSTLLMRKRGTGGVSDFAVCMPSGESFLTAMQGPLGDECAGCAHGRASP